jgi:cell division protein FtsL
VRDDARVERQRRRTKSSRLPLRPAAALAVLVIGLVLSSMFASVTIQENALARTIDELKTQIGYEQAYSAQLQASAAEKKSTDYLIEKAKQLGWVWPWEALIAVQRDANARAQSTPASERPSRTSRWLALFAGTR